MLQCYLNSGQFPSLIEESQAGYLRAACTKNKSSLSYFYGYVIWQKEMSGGWHSGVGGSIDTSQFQGPWINPGLWFV